MGWKLTWQIKWSLVSSCSFIKENKGSGELTYWLRTLSALPEDLSSLPSTHVAAHNHL